MAITLNSIHKSKTNIRDSLTQLTTTLTHTIEI